MRLVSTTKCTKVAKQDECDHFCIEVSDLFWERSPQHVMLEDYPVKGERTSLTDREVVWHGSGEDREIGGWIYSAPGVTLTVFND